MSIQDILGRNRGEIITIHPTETVRRAAERMRARNIAALIVKTGDEFIGLISEREIVHAIAQQGEGALSLTVQAVMSRATITVAPDDSVKRAMTLMTNYRVRHLPVIAGGKLVGIVSIGDVVKHRLQDLEAESNVLRDAYIARPMGRRQ
jgi:CBS domain-containing protein